jgi:mono/diheme cytochrome c family protein/glucose/arabinose dehydrogenase
MRFLPLLLSVVLTVPLAAQHGDRENDVQQKPPPESVKVPPAPVLSPEEALSTLQVAPGFRVEIAAADPLVHDPVAMTFGPDGRLWVVEMSGFMRDQDGKDENQKLGSIAVLEDTDGDGRMDKRTTFIDKLVMPRALALVGDGLLVGEPPNLWFCRDTNGDGVADEKISIAQDYGNQSNPEHTANGLMRALDNWIYNANYSYRFRYEGAGRFSREPTTTGGQWGISQDDFGHIFTNSNSDPLRGDLVPAAYYRRNPGLASPAGLYVQLANKGPVFPARVTTGINRGYKSLDDEGKMTEFTAACAPLVYRGGLFAQEFDGNAFVCEPAGNFVRRYVLADENGKLKAHNPYPKSEFLASTDERFRPVNLANGPDGALYIVDMYRGIIQHRIYMTTYLRKEVEARKLFEGLGMGRIYRVVPVGPVGKKAPSVNLAKASVQQLGAALADRNGWVRDTAQRLLVERRDPAAAGLLAQFFEPEKLKGTDLAPSAITPLARLHALWTLEGLGAIDRATVLRALADPDAGVCAAAIRLAEKWLRPPGDAELLARVSALGERPEPAVRLQLAFSLGEVGPSGDAALVDCALRSGTQLYVPEAIVSGIAGRESNFVKRLAESAKQPTPALVSIVAMATSSALKPRDPARVEAALAPLAPDTGTPPWIKLALLDGVLRFLSKTPDGVPVATSIAAEPRALLALAAQKDGSEETKRAATLADKLYWPGKPGVEKDAAAAARARLSSDRRALALYEKGKEQFALICAACHQPTGEGLAGLAPPLLYSRWVLGPEKTLVRIVLNGKEKEGRIMPPLKTLDDETIAGILTYIRNTWGHEAKPIFPRAVGAIRAEVGAREDPWSDEELSSLLD